MSHELLQDTGPNAEYADRVRFGSHDNGELKKYSGIPEDGTFDNKHFLDTALITAGQIQEAASKGDLPHFDQHTQEKLSDGSLRLVGEGVPGVVEHNKFNQVLIMAVGEVAFREYVDKILVADSELRGAEAEANILELARQNGLNEDQAYIFAPVVEPVPDTKSVDDVVDGILGGSEDYYSHLFTDTDEDFNRNRSTESAAVSVDSKERAVTDGSRQEAVSALAKVQDFIVRDEINHFARDHGVKSEKEKVDLIRTNAELRYKIAKGLLRKLEGLVGGTTLPERVGRPDEQKAPARQYGKNSTLPSRDYVVALSLSMLDGTFENSATDTEPSNVPLSKRTHGQHRGVARALLFNEY